MKVVVTGGAGFIGSHVVDALIERGDQVVCVDNFNTFYDPQIKERNIRHHQHNSDFKLYREDILNLPALRDIFHCEQPDAIIHLAARAGVRPSIKQPELYEEVNVRGTLHLLQCAKEFIVRTFVFGSSSSVYGNQQGPFKETDTADNPISPYAATKKAGELLCHTFHHLYDINIFCLRFFTVYGPRGRLDMAPLKFTTLIAQGNEIQMYGDGSSERDYTYVSDIVQGVLAALDNCRGYEIINLGNSHPIQLKQFISIIEKALNKTAKTVHTEIQQGDVDSTYADISKAKQLLDYNPAVNIDEGIRNLVTWHTQQESSQLTQS